MTQIEHILDVFQAFRMPPTPIDQYEQIGKAILAEKIGKFVINNKPIEFVMLGFPFKSTNIRDKVLGIKPDLGEEIALNNFMKFNREIQAFYSKGIKISMASDGFMFNDILNVPDNTVIEYKEISNDFIKDDSVVIYDLNDFFSGNSIATKREKAMSNFGISYEKLQAEILLNPDINYLYRGMLRFMAEEIAPKGFSSRNQLEKEAKRLTREMMLRNEAYSNLVRKEFADCIRLSMHPSVNNGYKYSFQLIPGPNRHSPWHSAIVTDGEGNYETVHKAEAIEKGYSLQYRNSQPYYFTK